MYCNSISSNLIVNADFLEWVFSFVLSILIQRHKDGVVDELTLWLIKILKVTTFFLTKKK